MRGYWTAMEFEAIDLAQGSNIQFSIQRWTGDKRPYRSILLISFSGDYRDGAAGGPDALYMNGIVGMINEIWSPGGIILDLRNINYKWGDEMDLVLSAPSQDPFAVLVSEKCEPAISTLVLGLESKESVLQQDGFFDSLDAAFNFIQQKLGQ